MKKLQEVLRKGSLTAGIIVACAVGAIGASLIALACWGWIQWQWPLLSGMGKLAGIGASFGVGLISWLLPAIAAKSLGTRSYERRSKVPVAIKTGKRASEVAWGNFRGALMAFTDALYRHKYEDKGYPAQQKETLHLWALMAAQLSGRCGASSHYMSDRLGHVSVQVEFGDVEIRVTVTMNDPTGLPTSDTLSWSRIK